jgi:hypothetical protein
MTKQEQIKHFDQIVAEARNILLTKGDDYSGDDRLSNFKLVASMTKTTPEKVALMFIATKVARLGELLNGKTPKNESIKDSITDLINYAILLDMILSDKID